MMRLKQRTLRIQGGRPGPASGCIINLTSHKRAFQQHARADRIFLGFLEKNEFTYSLPFLLVFP